MSLARYYGISGNPPHLTPPFDFHTIGSRLFPDAIEMVGFSRVCVCVDERSASLRVGKDRSPDPARQVGGHFDTITLTIHSVELQLELPPGLWHNAQFQVGRIFKGDPQ